MANPVASSRGLGCLSGQRTALTDALGPGRFSKPTLSTLASVLLLLVLATVLLASADQKKPSVFVNDKGKFKVLLNDKVIGHEEFEITSSGATWTAKATTHLAVEGAPATTVTGNLALQPEGAPISYDWTTQADKNSSAHIAFANGVAKMTVQLGTAHPFEQISRSLPR